MKYILKTKAVLTRSFMAVLGIVFGLIIIAQINTLPTRTVSNPLRPITSLKDTREILYSEQNDLKIELDSIQTKLDELIDQNNRTLSANDLAKLRYKKAQAGQTKLSGPGVIIQLDDSKNSSTQIDSIVHAADIRDVVNLLWGSTAEAISINDERVVSSTAIDCIVNTILINNTRISNPFVIKAIGDKGIMQSRLNDEGILSDLHNRKKAGLAFTVEQKDFVEIPAYTGVYNYLISAN